MSSNQNNLIGRKGDKFSIQNYWEIIVGYENIHRKYNY